MTARIIPPEPGALSPTFDATGRVIVPFPSKPESTRLNPPSPPSSLEANRVDLPPPRPSSDSPIGSARNYQAPASPENPWSDLARSEEPSEELPTKEVRRKKKKKRNALPAECYVGTAANHLDEKGMVRFKKSRRAEFPDGDQETKKKRRRLEDPEAPPRSGTWLFVLSGLFIVAATSLALAARYGVIDLAKWGVPDYWLFWKKQPAITGDPRLGDKIRDEVKKFDEKTGNARAEAKKALQSFLSAETWDDAVKLLQTDNVPSDSNALSMIKVFPRKLWLNRPLRFESMERVPNSERFVFTTFLESEDDKRHHFVVLEQAVDGQFQIHALPIHQNWWGLLSDFLATPGSKGGRFYVQVALAASGESEKEVALPNDGIYLKLRLQDPFNGYGRQWLQDGYIKENNPAGIRLKMKINPQHWSRAILDLEWATGPKGDPYVHVVGLKASNWGDFP